MFAFEIVLIIPPVSMCKFARSSYSYLNDPKFSDRQVWANIADPDQTAPRCF